MFDLKATGVSDTEFPDPSAPPPGRIARGTEQQEALWAHLVTGAGNVIVEARAGCGKSSSCREGMYRLLEARPGLRVSYAVFSTANANEFRGHCPPSVNVGTVHSFGYAALRRAFGSQIEKTKTYVVLDDLPGGSDLPRYLRKSVAMLTGLAKNQAVSPARVDPGWLADLALHFDVNTYHQVAKVVDWTTRVLVRSAEWVSLIDFDDMLWLPSLYSLEFEPCDVLFIDEVQDCNPAQHALVPLLARTGRVVAVGDRFQAIYAWRGADPESMTRLAVQLDTGRGLTRLPLTLTFRCPRSHVRLAQRFVPDLEAHGSNAEGAVLPVGPDEVAKARPGDLVLARTNAEAIRAALQAIAVLKPALVRGRAVGDQLLQVVRGCGECRTIGDLAHAVQRWAGRELARLEKQEGAEDLVDAVLDRAAGLQAILSGCQTPADVEGAIGELFADRPPSGVVQFSTIHRAKGAEAERVWVIQAPARKSTRPEQDWQLQQEANLSYVSLTRSKADLFLVGPA